MARSIEEAHVRAQRYQPPPSSVKGLLEPELRYRRTEGSAPSTNCLAASTPCTSGPNMEENISLASLTNSLRGQKLYVGTAIRRDISSGSVRGRSKYFVSGVVAEM
nr:unnamed protein product [Callosobruchus analis]